MDHKELHASAKRARDAPVAAHAAHANTDSGQAAVLSPFVHSEGAAAKVSEPDRENSISVETTMVQEESEDTEEEEEGSGAGQKKHRRGGQPMRRSERIALVESMAPRQQPVPREEEHDEDRPRQRQRRSGPRPQQPIFPPGQPLPQVPFQVFCGTAKGTWDPEDPLVISVTEPAEPAGGSGGRGRGRGRNTAYTVSCSEFERLGGRGRNKNWKREFLRAIYIIKNVCSPRSLSRLQILCASSPLAGHSTTTQSSNLPRLWASPLTSSPEAP